MPLEAASWIAELNAANPPGSDQQSQGDDHIRLLKTVLAATFPNADKAFYFPGMSSTLASSPTVQTGQNQMFFPINALDSARTVTLPATPPDGFKIWVMKTDSSVNPVTIAAGVNINGAASFLLRHQYDAVEVVYGATANLWRATSNRFRFPTVRAVESTTVDVRDVGGLIRSDTAGGTRTVTLPEGLPAGFSCQIQRIGAGTNELVLDATSGGSINGANTLVMTGPLQVMEVVWTGSTWVAANVQFATAGEVRIAAAGKAITPDSIPAATAAVELAYSATPALNWLSGFFRTLVLEDDAQLQNPSNGQPGTFRQIYVIGDSTTERELTFGSQYGGEVPVLDDITSTKGYLVQIFCVTSTHFVVAMVDGSPPA